MLSPDGTLMSASAAPHCKNRSGLKETFIKRYIVERTNKTEIRPEEQSEETENSRENLWNKIRLKERETERERRSVCV